MAKQLTYVKVNQHIVDIELADILDLNEEERTFVKHFLSGNEEHHANELTSKELDIPLNNGYNRRIKIKQYIAISIKRANEVIKKKDGVSVITVTEVVEELATMLKRDGGEDGRVRVKAGEILLRHLNGFSKHNESKANKTMININSMSDEDLQERINKLQQNIQTIDLNQERPTLIDLSTIDVAELYEEFELNRSSDET